MLFAGVSLFPFEDGGFVQYKQLPFSFPDPKFTSQIPGFFLESGSKSGRSPDTALTLGWGCSLAEPGGRAPSTTCVAVPGLLPIKSEARENATFAK